MGVVSLGLHADSLGMSQLGGSLDAGATASAPAERRFETASTVPSPTSVPASPTSQPPTTLPTVGLIWGFDATPPSPTWVKPPRFAPGFDPVYGTAVRRLTSADGTRFDRNTYSRRQAENADGTMFMTYHGDAEYRVYDRVTGDLVRVLPIHPDGEPQWHPTDPEAVRHIAGSNSSVGDLRLYETSVRQGSTEVIADLTERVTAAFPEARYLADRAEGSPSVNGARYAWIVFDAAEDAIAVVSYDLSGDTVLAAEPLESDRGALDWVSMSPTGAFVVAGYLDGTMVYDADLGTGAALNDKADHSDLALDRDGRDTYVYIDFSSGADAGWLVAVDLATRDRTRIFDLYDDANTSVHVSGKGYERPGWVVVSTYNCKDLGAWSCEKVMAVELAGEQRVLNLAHTYNCGNNYWTETHAVVNRSFTRVYFNSDGGSCGIDAEVYELTLPVF